MNNKIPSVLIIEDDIDILEGYKLELEDPESYEIVTAQTVRQARTILNNTTFAVVLTDLKLRTADRGGLTILDEVKKKSPDTIVIVFTGVGGTLDARDAERLDADGYLRKEELDFENVRQVVRNGIVAFQKRASLRDKVHANRAKQLPTPERFVYACSKMSDLRNTAALLAKEASQNIFILGEVGTGKGLLAEGIHFGSNRQSFELINCGSLSERSLENIIFGFFDESTVTYRQSLIERLNGGTLVLDRVSNLSVRLQEKLTEVLISKSFQLSVNHEMISIDLRIIAIDEIDLSLSVKQGFFHKKLYEIICQETLFVPPLRERVDNDRRYEDVLVLADHFITKYSHTSSPNNLPKISAEAEFILRSYPFPGNIRELEQSIRFALNNLTGETILPSHFPLRMQKHGIQLSLGANNLDDGTVVLCPHGAGICNRTKDIRNNFLKRNGVFLHFNFHNNEEINLQIRSGILKFGLDIYPPENIRDALTAMCGTCVPLQSSHYAIFDVSVMNVQIFYELGMAHALGIPVLILAHNNIELVPNFYNTVIQRYSHDKDVVEVIHEWLSSHLV